LALDKVISL